ncbi:MAG: hypothetical protein C4520_18720 [Candidatus Abyssobacteria bacterium SURF_5]|uniref:TRASH domain-containing protein n=1 Tax=Abyssobacteria bacterium (strain SURF_5) TaxID=2093360 RepID=A0A3A4NGD2_ABYX5|nr:MAG: hypothetical protein C4520_18720 [Candidatus Abyssubacteria bacterium SURF_5]
MNSHTICQVCGKLIGPKEMHFKTTYEGNTYYACCSICLSILQKQSRKHIRARMDNLGDIKRCC